MYKIYWSPHLLFSFYFDDYQAVPLYRLSSFLTLYIIFVLISVPSYYFFAFLLFFILLGGAINETRVYQKAWKREDGEA